MKGFSLIEILVVLGIISIVGSVSVVTYNTVRQVGDVKHATYVFVDALKEAENKAKMMDTDTTWGVNVLEKEVIVFSGPSYTSRLSEKSYDLPSNLVVSGPTEIVFAKFTGAPNNYGEVVFSNNFGTSSVSLSAGGVISY